MSYEVLLAPSAQRDIKKLPPDTRDRIRVAMAGLAKHPRGRAQKLAGEHSYRVRVGDYRIVYRIDDGAREVLVARVKHRRDVYRR
ncbi:MAG: type II toxin-antitoxin system RelE family toxin [Actinomycetota bacterium]